METNEHKNASKKDLSNHYIKKVNISIPSGEKLNNEKFRNDFLEDYESSFASFCEISKDKYEELYIKNQYIPRLNKFGDINISLDNITKILNKFSASKLLKIRRKIKKSRKKLGPKAKKEHPLNDKLFKIEAKTSINKRKNFNISLDEEMSEINIERKIKIDKIIDSNLSKNKNNEGVSSNIFNVNKDNKPKDKTLLNIKRKLKSIQIPKEYKASSENKQNINYIPNRIMEYQFTSNQTKSIIKGDNNNILSSPKTIIPNNDYANKESLSLKDDNGKNYSNLNDFKFSANSKNNNIFNFSSNIIHDSNNIFKINTPVYTPYINNNANPKMEDNTPIYDYNNLLSPMFLSPERNNLMSPHGFSFNSPFNINSVFSDTFRFLNNNGNDSNNDNDEENNNNKKKEK